MSTFFALLLFMFSHTGDRLPFVGMELLNYGFVVQVLPCKNHQLGVQFSLLPLSSFNGG